MEKGQRVNQSENKDLFESEEKKPQKIKYSGVTWTK